MSLLSNAQPAKFDELVGFELELVVGYATCLLYKIRAIHLRSPLRDHSDVMVDNRLTDPEGGGHVPPEAQHGVSFHVQASNFGHVPHHIKNFSDPRM